MLDVANNYVKHNKHLIDYYVRMSLQTRINKLFSENPDKKPAHFAKFAGISRAAVSDWMSGNVKNISGSNGIKVGEYFGVNSEWVISGKSRSSLINEKRPTNYDQANNLLIDTKHRQISRTLISWSDYCSDTNSNIKPEFDTVLIDKETEVTEDCFLLRINTDAFHHLTKGITLLIDPDATPKKNDVIIIKFNDDIPTLARYMPGMGEQHIVPLEKGYPGSISLENKNVSILGVAISAHPKSFKP